MAKKRSKFRAIPTTVAGIRFASRKEARVYTTLASAQRGGAIRDLQLQVRFPLFVNGVLVTTYVADFVYFDVADQRRVVADAKGFVTREYKIKRQLMLAIHGIEIFEM